MVCDDLVDDDCSGVKGFFTVFIVGDLLTTVSCDIQDGFGIRKHIGSLNIRPVHDIDEVEKI